MGRNNTKAVKNITKMYEQLGLAQDDIFHKTKLLLSIYRDVVWATLSDCNCVNEETYYYGDDLTDALVYLEEFAPDIERSEFERRVCNLFENKWMIDLIDKAMSKVYDYYNNGRLYHEILSKSYLTAFRYTESELLEILNLERSTFYDRKKEAVMLLGIALWGYAIPVFRGILKKLMAREDVASIVCATDAGREGELIFRLVYHKAGCRKPFERLWISSMEDVAIKEGFENLRSGTEYDALYQPCLFLFPANGRASGAYLGLY